MLSGQVWMLRSPLHLGVVTLFTKEWGRHREWAETANGPAEKLSGTTLYMSPALPTSPAFSSVPSP